MKETIANVMDSTGKTILPILHWHYLNHEEAKKGTQNKMRGKKNNHYFV